MNFIKHYWFGSFIGLLLFCFVCVVVLILLAPKQDIQRRGFIPCTEKMIERLFDCDKKIWCSAKVIVRNSGCVFRVIGDGFSDWLKGKQPMPWSNYIFEPELFPEGFVDEEARQEYLSKYPDTKKEMERLHRLRKDIENENNKQLEAENNWQPEK